MIHQLILKFWILNNNLILISDKKNKVLAQQKKIKMIIQNYLTSKTIINTTYMDNIDMPGEN